MSTCRLIWTSHKWPLFKTKSLPLSLLLKPFIPSQWYDPFSGNSPMSLRCISINSLFVICVSLNSFNCLYHQVFVNYFTWHTLHWQFSISEEIIAKQKEILQWTGIHIQIWSILGTVEQWKKLQALSNKGKSQGCWPLPDLITAEPGRLQATLDCIARNCQNTQNYWAKKSYLKMEKLMDSPLDNSQSKHEKQTWESERYQPIRESQSPNVSACLQK